MTSSPILLDDRKMISEYSNRLVWIEDKPENSQGFTLCLIENENEQAYGVYQIRCQNGISLYYHF